MSATQINMTISIGWFALATMVLAALLAGWLLSLAHKHMLYDRQNDRSAHTEPTPRLGGGAIVILGLLGYGVAASWFGLPLNQLIGLAGGGLLVAGIGILDDLRDLRASARLVAHIAAAIWAVFWIGPFDFGFLPFWGAEWSGAAAAITVLAIVWMINLYNFMDGINGLAATEAIGITGAGAILLGVTGAGPGAVAAVILLAAACAGFLPWNFPRARTFMGDASSGFLGFSLGTLAVVVSQIDEVAGAGWWVLSGVFVVDASVTVARRLLRGQRVHEAHSEHAYQRLARRAGSHAVVTLGGVAVTWLWLFPLALCMVARVLDPMAGICVALVPLVIAAITIGAGRPRGQAIDARTTVT